MAKYKYHYGGVKACPLAKGCSLVGEEKACNGTYIRGIDEMAGGRETKDNGIVYSVECASRSKVLSLEKMGVST